MNRRKTSWIAWGLSIALLAALLLGARPVYHWSRSVWIARHRGEGANLRCALLILAPLRGVSLQSAHLQEARLVGANLAGANLGEAELDAANLTGANLSRAKLSGTSLRSANLSHANLQGAQFWTDLTGANLSGADLRSSVMVVEMERANLTGADLRNAVIGYANLRGAVLRGANLSNARLGAIDPVVPASILAGADLSGAVLTGLVYYRDTVWPKGFDPRKHGARAIEPRADLRGLNLDQMILSGQRLQGANLERASLRRVDLEQARLQKADLRGADLTGADLTDARLDGAIYDRRTRWPQGFNVQRHLAKERALARRPPPWQRLLRQRRRLPDGRTLLLEAVTYGKEHRWPKTEWIESIAHFDEELWAHRSAQPVLYLWMILYGKNPYASPYTSSNLQVVVSDGRGWHSSPGMTDSVLRCPAYSRVSRQEGALTLWQPRAFPRRNKTFHVRFFTRENPKLVAEFVVPNPTPGLHPVWKAQPLPVTREAGDVAFTLTRLVTGVPLKNRPSHLSERNAWSAATFQVRQKGTPTRSWLPRLVQGSDVTGHADSIRYSWGVFERGAPRLYFDDDPLPEDVWKLRFEFVQVGDFSPDEVWTVRDIPVPGKGKKQPVNATTTRGETTLHLLSISTSVVRVRGTGIPPDRRLALIRAADDCGRDLEPRGPSPEVWLDRPFPARGEWEFRLDPAKDAKTVDLTFALQKRRTVEFLVSPVRRSRAHTRQVLAGIKERLKIPQVRNTPLDAPLRTGTARRPPPR